MDVVSLFLWSSAIITEKLPMYNHTPKDYICPLCLAVMGRENDRTMMKQADIIYKDNDLMVCVNSKFVKNNLGHVIIVPTSHFENIYDLPNEVGHKILDMAKLTAVALKSTYNCKGITMMQNNEPAGGQHAFHYHLHIFPRYQNDQFYKYLLTATEVTPETRKPYAQKLRKYFNNLDFEMK